MSKIISIFIIVMFVASCMKNGGSVNEKDKAEDSKILPLSAVVVSVGQDHEYLIEIRKNIFEDEYVITDLILDENIRIEDCSNSREIPFNLKLKISDKVDSHSLQIMISNKNKVEDYRVDINLETKKILFEKAKAKPYGYIETLCNENNEMSKQHMKHGDFFEIKNKYNFTPHIERQLLDIVNVNMDVGISSRKGNGDSALRSFDREKRSQFINMLTQKDYFENYDEYTLWFEDNSSVFLINKHGINLEILPNPDQKELKPHDNIIIKIDDDDDDDKFSRIQIKENSGLKLSKKIYQSSSYVLFFEIINLDYSNIELKFFSKRKNRNLTITLNLKENKFEINETI